MKGKTCEWKLTDVYYTGYYESVCEAECGGNIRADIEDFKFCPFCGCEIVIYDPPSAEDELEQRVRDGEIDTMGRVR